MSVKSTQEEGRDAQQEALQHAPATTPHSQSFAVLALTVLGVVYGDIGTSPIYALRECFTGKHPIPISQDNVLGILSLISWTLVLVISLKYMTYVLRADNRGEGGTFALLALLRPEQDQARRRRRALMLLGILGASMLYGGAMITPAISVLSAVEGLQLAAPTLHRYVVPITVLILILLFSVQRRGTAVVGAVFGPVMLIWFAVLALLGLRGILHAPQVLLALNPWYAVRFFADNGRTGYLVLYAVFLVATGGEALYADLGHFGRQPIRRVWFAFVLPALLINYFGQGALLLAEPGTSLHPFFHLAPAWGLYPLVALATAATCIASQAVITGAYSLTRQAMQLGLFPRLTVAQTSAQARGQIYMPAVNFVLMIAAIGLVLAFRSSDIIEPVPATSGDERLELTQIDAGFYRIVLRYGFMQTPNIPSELSACAELGLPLDLDQLHYVIGQIDLLAGRKRHGMVLWRDKLFAFLARNTEDITANYQIPADQVMKVGLQVGI